MPDKTCNVIFHISLHLDYFCCRRNIIGIPQRIHSVIHGCLSNKHKEQGRTEVKHFRGRFLTTTLKERETLFASVFRMSLAREQPLIPTVQGNYRTFFKLTILTSVTLGSVLQAGRSLNCLNLPHPSSRTGVYSAANRKRKNCFWEIKRGWRVRLTTSPTSVSPVSRKRRILDVSQPWASTAPYKESFTFHFYLYDSHVHITFTFT
jgi:hypothetical protein